MVHRNKVGLGTFPLANVFTPISVKEAESLVSRFIDLGGYYIDTAPMYGNGEVEKLLGRVLKSVPRENYFLCTKTVKHVDEQGQLFKSGKYEDVITQIDTSLKRLQVDYVDLLMVHSPDPNVPIDETLRALEKLQDSGKVRQLAVSNVNLSELMAYNSTGKITYVQNRFSLINRSVSQEFETYITEHHISLIPYHLFEIGLLTDKAFQDIPLQGNDMRKTLPYWNNENQTIISQWVRTHLGPMAKRLGMTIGQINISWALRHPYIDFVVVGTTNPTDLATNLLANNMALSDDEMDDLDADYDEFEKEIQSTYHKSVREFRGLNEKFY